MRPLRFLFVALLSCTPALAQTVTQANIDAAFAYHAAHKGEALLVQQNGKVTYSKYSGSYTGGLHTLASGTKSFTCAIEAFAEADGLLTIDDQAADTIPEWQADSRKRITLGDLLSLESGLAAGGIFGAGDVRTLDTYAQSIHRAATNPPRVAFVYDPLSFQSFASILEAKTHTDPVAFLQQKLFTPLGIDSKAYLWTRDAKGHPQMAGGASMHATDWIKYGQWMLDGGVVDGKPLVDPKLLTRCVTYPDPAYGGYGLTWWLNRHSGSTYDRTRDRVPPDTAPASGADQIAPHAPADMYMAAGAGKQRLYVIPSLGLVVVRFAQLSSAAIPWSDDQFLGLLLGTLAK